MLVRRKLKPVPTDPKNLDAYASHSAEIPDQEAKLDQWEHVDCLHCIAVAFSAVILVGPAGKEWHPVPCGDPFATDVDQCLQQVPVPEGMSAEYDYFRRPVDINRERHWKMDPTYFIRPRNW